MSFGTCAGEEAVRRLDPLREVVLLRLLDDLAVLREQLGVEALGRRQVGAGTDGRASARASAVKSWPPADSSDDGLVGTPLLSGLRSGDATSVTVARAGRRGGGIVAMTGGRQ